MKNDDNTLNTVGKAATMYDLNETILARHSVRKFLPRPVPKELLDECLELAQHAPSNSNIQPWRMFFVAGEVRERLKDAFLEVARVGAPNAPPLPEHFQHFRIELGSRVYGEGMGIPREDKEGRRLALLRNWEFFGAPLAGFVCIDKELGNPDVVAVGMYLQTLVLSLSARGVGSCVQAALAGYPEVIYRELNVPRELLIICGMSIGYADPDFKGNHLNIGRSPVDHNVTILGY
jgi:nitroreductase